MTGGQDSSLLNGSAANASDTEQRRRRTSTSFSKTDRVAVEIVAGALTENSKTKEEMEKAKQKEMLANSPSFFAILRMNKPEWPYILLACVGSLILGGGMPLFALFFSEVIRVFGKVLIARGFGDEMLAEATFWALMFLVLGASQFVGHIISAAGMGISGERLTARLRAGYFRSMLRQDMSFFDSPDNSVGALTTRLASDASSVKGAAGVRLALPLQAIFGAGIGLGIALYYGWQLALMILGCVPLMAVAGAVHMAYQTRSQKASDKGTEMAGQTAAEAIENLPTVQSLGREEVFYTRYRDFLSEPYRKRLFATLLGGLTYGFSQIRVTVNTSVKLPLGHNLILAFQTKSNADPNQAPMHFQSIVFFIYAASFRFGAYLVSIDQMEVNNVFKVFFSITFAGLMAGQTFSLIPDYAKARIAAGYIIALLNREPLIDNRSESGDRPQKLIGELRLVDVDFEYPQRAGTRVLRRLNLTIPAGRTVALVGPSGCGKSTVVSLLQRYYDPMTPDGELVGGRVELDGRDVRQLNLAWLRRNIRVVNQEPVLFARSIADNLTYGLNEEPESDCLEEVVRLSNISDFVKHLPDGMDTQVGEKGAQLSGGQKQRVALARALITRPKILLLDEATSALDSESEALVQAALDEARQGRTCILVAHRLSTVQSADVIVVMEGGRVVETGTHAELMRLGGAYYSMANSAMRKGGTLLPPGTG
uniref:ABC transporter domain-containing protein n=2 Tax=Macrostomum lignano TaxID=282301 RepID=A0A1I8I8M6_9PLAT